MPAVDAPDSLISTRDLARLLGVPLRELTWWIYALDSDKRYNRFLLAKRSSGAPRIIEAPIKPIKDMQRTLAAWLSRWYTLPIHVHGFVAQRSPQTNALLHRSKNWVLRVDLANFFPSIHFGRVRGMLMADPFMCSESVATVMAHLCCHNGALPQGAPTSPVISNLICRGFDAQVAELARRERCHYTRYADDIVFSTTRRNFPPDLAFTNEADQTEVGVKLDRLIRHHGFSPNADKTRLMSHSQRQRVTGLVVNKRVNIAKSDVRSLRNLLHIWDRYGAEAAEESMLRHRTFNRPPGQAAPDFRLTVRGQVQYVGQIRGWGDAIYQRLASKLSLLDESYVPRFGHELPSGPHPFLLLTEGPSDVDHLLAAHEWFRLRQEFTDLDIKPSPDQPRGSSRLLRRCRELAQETSNMPTICVFDRDEDAVLREVLDTGSFKHWGNGVMSLALEPPSNFEYSDRFCIEMLYPSSTIKATDVDGRRLFLADEFEGKFDRSGRYHTPGVGQNLVLTSVTRLADSKSVALSKVSFAHAVRARQPPHQDVPFDRFRPTFEAIRRAVGAALPHLSSRQDRRP